MPEWLTRKYGPLAAWQWAALGAGGFLLYRFYKARQAAAASTSSVGSATTAAGTTTPTYTPPSATVSLPGGGSYSGPASDLSGILGQLQPTGTSPSDQISFTTPGGASYSGGAGSVPAGLITQSSPEPVPAPAAAAPAPTYTPVSAFANFGQGYGSYPGQQVTTPQGAFYPIGSAAQASGLVQSGQPVYYFPIPGLAQPVTPGITNVPEYGKVQ